MNRLQWAVLAVCPVIVAACATQNAAPAKTAAQMERLEIKSRAPAFGGAGYGAVGPYEMIVAVAHLRVDPLHPANRDIVDLDKAPVADGWVRYETNVVILRPVNAAAASPVLLFDVANRGSKLAPVRLNDGAAQFDTAAQAGQGFIMRKGYTMVWAGWQGDVPLTGDGKLVGTNFPIASAAGKPITGPSLEEIEFDAPGATGVLPLTYPAATMDQAQATLTVRATTQAPPTVLPASAWRYKSASEVEITRPAGFDGGAIYQFLYVARDPLVMGLGFAAVRDVVSFLKAGAPDSAGTINPLADIRPQVTVAIGISQSGRFLRDFVWQGFNAAPNGGKVFDGMLALIAGSRKSYTNARFAQPGRFSRQHEDHLYDGDQFPFSYAVTTDPVSGRTDGIFARCEPTQTCPKTMQLDSNLEFWQGRASLVVTDGVGKDLPLPGDVRLYLMSSTQHGPAVTPAAGICQNLNNPAPQAPAMRALLERLIDWIRNATPPPDSRYPTLSNRLLVAPNQASVGFPDLTGLGVKFPAVINQLDVVDHSGATPRIDLNRHYELLLPVTDTDGHDVAGVRLPDIDVPLATHSGWNLRRTGFAEDQLCGLNGVYVPLQPTAAERIARHDPRPSVAERYPDRSSYVEAVARSARNLQAAGLLLDEDATRYIDRAKGEKRIP